ncbi:unnamed protein product [Ceutorhynchus assimilis]|uniref:Uncharacterized protein n=1 Tax=Ceutorhynchus assimilis TaxID=467358 RepID=A0A9N9MVF6_9CUCU|nr:unnamed protein product [Ceutorhynchus assimilis]
MDWEDTVTVEHVDTEWHQYFQNALKTDHKLDYNQNNHCWCKCSENGIDFEMTDNERQHYISFLVKIPKLFDKLKHWPITEQKLLVLAVARIISSNEKTFIQINTNSTYNALVKMAEITKTTTSTPVKVRYIDMICSFVEHEAGLKWTLENECWTGIWDLVMQCHEENCDEVNQNLYNIISKFLQKTSKCSPKICEHVTKQIMQPVISSANKNYPKTKKEPIEMINIKDCKNLEQTLKCSIGILERLLANISETGSEALKYFSHLLHSCEILSILSNNIESSMQLNCVMTILCFYGITELFDGITVVNHDPLVLSGFLKIVEREMRKENLKSVLELFYYAQKYWDCISTRVPKHFQNGKPIDIKYVLTAFQVEPIMLLGEKLLQNPYSDEETEKLFRDISLKAMTNRMSEECVKLGYKLRSEYAKAPMGSELTAFKCIIKSKPLYSRECLALVFQILIYGFKDFVKYVNGDAKLAEIEHNQLIGEGMLQAILVFLEDFDLSWRESLGSLELPGLNYEFYTCTNKWNPNVVLLFLKILDITISKNLSANMVLLVDYNSDHVDGLDNMGSMLLGKCASHKVEVREAAMTVVCTICEKVNEGFKSFERILLHHVTLDIILTIATSDFINSIRAIALTCLQKMIVMNQFEAYFLSSPFINKIIEHIAKEKDPNALKVSLKLIRQIYENNYNKITDNLVQIYSLMSKVAIEGENMDVQEEAVKFWEFVTRQNLERQGMIDDDFPNVTFSKEQKKIIRLDEKEIRKRLFQAMDSMSKTGCFNVYRQILVNPDTPANVLATTITIITNFSKLLKRYDVTREFITLNQNYPNLWSIASNIESPASNCAVNDESLGELIEETMMQMTGELSFTEMFPLPSNLNEAGEFLMLKDPENPIVQVSPVDFIEFIYRKLPSLRT